MRTKGPSGTASMVTLIRALAHGGLTHVRDFQDPTAFVLLTARGRMLCRYLLWRARKPGFRQSLLAGKSGLGTDLVPLRTRVLDDAWHAAQAKGTRQLVLLGAGLDGRAYRLEDIGESNVFEVDHPATQGLKRQRAAKLASLANNHLFVPVDFERDSLSNALEAAGQRMDLPTFWIWEGVTPYLTRRAQEVTLAAMAERSSAGSRVAMTYTQPPAPGDKAKSMRQTMKLVRFLGEPFLGLLTRAEAEELLRNAGFRILEDTGVEDWRQRYADSSSRASVVYQQRIAVAEKADLVSGRLPKKESPRLVRARALPQPVTSSAAAAAAAGRPRRGRGAPGPPWPPAPCTPRAPSGGRRAGSRPGPWPSAPWSAWPPSPPAGR